MMADAGEDTAAVPTRLTVGELLRLYPHRERITGWDPTNPPAVERAFRTGYLIGASRCADGTLDEAADLVERLHTRRGDLYHGELNVGFDRWSDRRAALLRGAMQGAIDAVRARAEGVKKGQTTWLEDLRVWATENPIRLDWEHARPPDWPEPDSRPLRRADVPASLWGEVFGLWALLTSPTQPPRPLGNLERILHPDPAVRRAATAQATPPEAPAERWPEPKAIAEFDCPQSLEWVWQGWVAIAHITALVAKWKAGKTTLLHHLLCARERGGDIAGPIAAGTTLVISEEHPTLWRKRSAGRRIGEHVKFICLPLITSIRDWFEFTEHVTSLVVRDGYTLAGR